MDRNGPEWIHQTVVKGSGELSQKDLLMNCPQGSSETLQKIWQIVHKHLVNCRERVWHIIVKDPSYRRERIQWIVHKDLVNCRRKDPSNRREWFQRVVAKGSIKSSWKDLLNHHERIRWIIGKDLLNHRICRIDMERISWALAERVHRHFYIYTVQ